MAKSQHGELALVTGGRAVVKFLEAGDPWNWVVSWAEIQGGCQDVTAAA